MNHKKSICIVSAQCYPHVGGVEQYVDNFSKELISRGYHVTIVTSSMEGTKAYEKKENLEIYRLPSLQLMNGRFPVLKKNKVVSSITKELLSRHFDVMLVNTRFYFISLYAVRLAKKMKTRCIILDHGTSHLNTGGRLSSMFGEVFEHGITWLEKLYHPEYAGVSKASLEWLKHFHIDSELVLYNALDLNRFEQMKKESLRDFRKEYGIPQEDVVIAFVGRFTIEKGIDKLTEAVKKINETRGDVWLLAAGDGYLLKELEPFKSENTHFVGKLVIEDVVHLLQCSDIFCLPSVSEGFPTSVLEAIACHCFVITTYTGGAKEIITDEDYGVILPDNATSGLYDGLLKVIDKKDYLQEAKNNCYKRLESNYTWERTVDRFLEVIDK